LSTFLKVAPHAKWRPPRRRFAVSFVSFSLRLFCQRKAAKSFCYQDFSNAFSFETIGTKEKALQKENAVFCANAARATAFEKAVQNNTFGSCEQRAQLPDKSKFEIIKER
jgi:hypothetical protein